VQEEDAEEDEEEILYRNCMKNKEKRERKCRFMVGGRR